MPNCTVIRVSVVLSLQGLDSPGGDYLVVDGGRGDLGRLREACGRTHRCIGESDAVWTIDL